MEQTNELVDPATFQDQTAVTYFKKLINTSPEETSLLIVEKIVLSALIADHIRLQQQAKKLSEFAEKILNAPSRAGYLDPCFLCGSKGPVSLVALEHRSLWLCDDRALCDARIKQKIEVSGL